VPKRRPVADLQTERSVKGRAGTFAGKRSGSPSQTKGMGARPKRRQIIVIKRPTQITGGILDPFVFFVPSNDLSCHMSHAKLRLLRPTRRLRCFAHCGRRGTTAIPCWVVPKDDLDASCLTFWSPCLLPSNLDTQPYQHRMANRKVIPPRAKFWKGKCPILLRDTSCLRACFVTVWCHFDCNFGKRLSL
jgi:hypothetical protein